MAEVTFLNFIFINFNKSVYIFRNKFWVKIKLEKFNSKKYILDKKNLNSYYHYEYYINLKKGNFSFTIKS